MATRWATRCERLKMKLKASLRAGSYDSCYKVEGCGLRLLQGLVSSDAFGDDPRGKVEGGVEGKFEVEGCALGIFPGVVNSNALNTALVNALCDVLGEVEGKLGDEQENWVLTLFLRLVDGNAL